MVLVIGSPAASDYDRPIALMGECHRRIERFLGVLTTLARERRGARLDADEAEAMATALIYFAEAAPKHTADEEESLFPRLRKALGDDSIQATAVLVELERDHCRAEGLHDDVETLGQRWLRNRSLEPDDARRLSCQLDSLTAIYREHIAIEDGTLFPLAETTLDTGAKRAIGQEMAKRRSASPSR